MQQEHEDDNPSVIIAAPGSAGAVLYHTMICVRLRRKDIKPTRRMSKRTAEAQGRKLCKSCDRESLMLPRTATCKGCGRVVPHGLHPTYPGWPLLQLHPRTRDILGRPHAAKHERGLCVACRSDETDEPVDTET